MKKSTSSRTDVYQIITNVIMEKLSEGIIPWRQTWSQIPAQNYYSGTIYRGINSLLLNSLGLAQPYFLTFSQLQKLGGRVKKGAHSYLVTYWRISYFDQDSRSWLTKEEAVHPLPEDVKVRPLLRYYRVFAIQDIEGITFQIPAAQQRIFTTQEKLEQGFAPLYIMPLPVALQSLHQEAYYSPMLDLINLPDINRFDSVESYFQVFYHELTHSTGNSKRLCREGITHLQPFGSWTYSKEELIAEMGSCFLMHHQGFETPATLENSAAYIQGWLCRLQQDPKFVVEAASKAQAAVDYILNIDGEGS